MSRAGEKLFASPKGSGIPLRQSYAQVGEIALICFHLASQRVTPAATTLTAVEAALGRPLWSP